MHVLRGFVAIAYGFDGAVLVAGAFCTSVTVCRSCAGGRASDIL